MDPISAFGLAASALNTVDIIARSVNFLLGLQTRYRQADLTLNLLIVQLSTLKAALNQIYDWINTSLIGVPGHEQVVLDLTTSIEGCKVLLSILNDRISSVERVGVDSLGMWGKTQLLWTENESNQYISYLNNQINALNLLLAALQCKSSYERNTLLQSDESLHTLQLAEDDKSSLLWLRDKDSCHTVHSVVTESSNMLDVEFGFDREVFSSRAYLVAMRANMKQAISRKVGKMAQRQGPPLDDARLVSSYERLNEAGVNVQRVESKSLNDDEHILSLDRDISPPEDPSSLVSPLSRIDMNSSQDDSTLLKRSTIKARLDLVLRRRFTFAEKYPVQPRTSPLTPTNCEVKVSTSTTNKVHRKLPYMPGWFELPSLPPSISLQQPQKNRVPLEMMKASAHAAPEENMKCHKVLLLGVKGAGKTTIFNSMRIYSGDDYSESELEAWKDNIHKIIIRVLQTISEFVSGFKESVLQFESFVIQIAIRGLFPPTPDVCLVINALWNNPKVQAIAGSMHDSWDYYFQNISRIASPDYVPTIQDILRSPPLTIGVTENRLVMGDFVYQIFDCGGSRGQRKKWFPFFWNVDAIIFPVDMSSYDQLPVEGDVAEALGLFEMICSLTIFKNTFIILFFNKVDLLRRKLARIPFDCYHSDFDADPLSLEAVKAYFTRKFLSLNRSEKNVKVCFADMVDDTSLGESAFAALEECMKLRKEKDDKKKEIPSALNSEIEDIAG